MLGADCFWAMGVYTLTHARTSVRDNGRGPSMPKPRESPRALQLARRCRYGDQVIVYILGADRVRFGQRNRTQSVVAIYGAKERGNDLHRPNSILCVRA